MNEHSNSGPSNQGSVETDLQSKRTLENTDADEGSHTHKRAKTLLSNKRTLVSSDNASNKKLRVMAESSQQVNNVVRTVSSGGSAALVENTNTPKTGEGNQTASNSKFHNIDINQLFMLEICAGSARLTKAAREHGFKGVAFDHSDIRSCGIEICNFDLADPQQLQDLLHFITIEAPNIAAIWIAPPCGTASRARERPLPGNLEGPKPLRSREQPDSIDGLQGVAKLKVEKANQLYDAVSIIAVHAHALDICVAIENPANSHFWGTTPMKELQAKVGDALATCCDSVLVCRGSNASLFCFISLGLVLLSVVTIPTGVLVGCMLIPVCTGSHSGVVPVYRFAEEGSLARLWFWKLLVPLKS